jgi:CPA2 family monovalent cation:H+ antiporter-2
VVTPEFQPILVTVAVLSTFTTALGLRQRERVTRWVDRAVPKRLHDLLAIYEEWFDEIRSPPGVSHGVGKAIRQILLDLALMTALVLAWKILRGDIAARLANTFALDAALSHTISALLLGGALLPLLVPLALIARRLSVLLADKVFKGERSSARASLRAALLLLILACVSVPVTLLIGGIVGVRYVWFAFALALGAAGAVTWRRVRALDEDLRSGGAMVLSAIARQGMPDAPEDSYASSVGLTKVHEVKLNETAYAFGKTLAELRLRSLTGASVVGVRDHDGAMHHPSAEEPLGADDTLFIAGCRVDQEAAEEYLLRGASTPRS